jgi:hypothetical protein
MTESSFSEKTAAAKKLFGTAAKLAQKQAELAKLNNVTLPKVYHAIGKRIVGSDKLPADLEHHRQRIRQLEAGIAATPEEIKRDPAGGFAAKAKQFAQQAAQKAAKATGDATATVQIQAAYVALGKEAVEKYGDKAVPKEFQSSLSDALRARASLEDDIRRLQQDSGVTIPSVPLLGLLGTVLFVVSVFLPFRSFMGQISGVSMFSNILKCQTDSWGMWLYFLPHFWSVLTNAVAIAAAVVLLAKKTNTAAALRLLRTMLIASLMLNVVCVAIDAISVGIGVVGIGFYLWLISFGILALAVNRQIGTLGETPVAVGAIAASRRSLSLFVAGIAVMLVVMNSFATSRAKIKSVSNEEPAVAQQQPSSSADPVGLEAYKAEQNRKLMKKMYDAAAFQLWQDSIGRQRQRENEEWRRRYPAPAAPSGDQPTYGNVPATPAPPRNAGARQRPQQFEGKCTRCGWDWGRRFTQGSRDSNRCAAISGEGIGLCGGVVVWTPVQDF